MQLNPARGRKLAIFDRHGLLIRLGGLCSSTPRGDGNAYRGTLLYKSCVDTVYAAQPREGTETIVWHGDKVCQTFEVYAAQPREGTETPRIRRTNDGCTVVYAAQPREGTETDGIHSATAETSSWFMQLNPARGRKLVGLVGPLTTC